MLIPIPEFLNTLKEHNVHLTGVLHIGAHNCEEKDVYDDMGLPTIWIDAIEERVNESTFYGIPAVYQALISDEDDALVPFYLSNNVESSSMFEFGTHSNYHPEVHYIGTRMLKTTTVDTFFARKALDPAKYNFWNLDIQGAEYKALKGGQEALKHAKVLYIEVNKEEMYKGCELVDKVEELLFPLGFKKVLDVTGPHCGDVVYIRS
jgi:FkbM family methyltransferase